MPRHNWTHIENEAAYNDAIRRRIFANATKTRERKFRENYPALDAWYRFPTWDSETQREQRHPAGPMPQFLVDAIAQWGGLTEGQARKASEILAERLGQNAQRDQQDAARRAAAPAWTAGRQAVVGVIKSAREESRSVYPHQVTVYKALVALEDGRLIWTSLPSALIPADIRELRGQKISMTVTVTVKENDSTFAFGKRPTGGAIVPAATE